MSRFPKLHVPLVGRPSSSLGVRTRDEEASSSSLGVRTRDEEASEERKDRKRRQTWMLMEDMDTFQELEFIMEEVSHHRNHNLNFYQISISILISIFTLISIIILI